MEEDLIEAFDNFVIGNFAAVLRRPSHSSPLWDSLAARCHLALGHLEKVREFSKSPALLSSAYFAVLQRAQQEGQRKSAIEKIFSTANESHGDPVACYYACVARALGGDLIDAINYSQAVAQSSPAEFSALRTQFCLAINRCDLAEKNLIENRDDSAACKLVSAMHALISGRAADACMSYSDLIAQFSAESALPLANGRAVGNIQRGLFAEAQEDLETALEKDENNPDGLRNLICCLAWQGKRSEAIKTLDKLRDVHPMHSLVNEAGKLQTAFAQFTV